MSSVIPARVVPSVEPDAATPRVVARDFRRLFDDGARWVVAGAAKKRPGRLLERGYLPRYRFELFDKTFYLANARQNPDIRFFVTYVVDGRKVHPRIFYKDVSLIWRSASHYIRSADENWVGKGDVRVETVDGAEVTTSAEETSDLPLEMQTALETLVRRAKRIPRDDDAIGLVLRRGGDDRIEPYADFSGPRRRAFENPRNRINRGRPIARFTRRGDPSSLVFARGFEPDFRRGVMETSESMSRLYGGRLRRFRILSRNRRVQYLFFAGPHHVWIIPPQATTAELSSYGVRTVDVIADEDLCVPGFEYHFMDDSEDPPVLHSQIPEGFAGDPAPVDPSRADASAWLDRLPVVRAFRRSLLRER